MTEYLNVFEPYQRKSAHHEDALTRAFLLVLRGVPVAHASWLHLVDQAHRKNGGQGVRPLHEHVAPVIAMQTGSVPPQTEFVVSIVQTNEEVDVPTDAKPSDRKQVLDGVVNYGPLSIVIENKPWHGNIWNKQLEVNLPEGCEHDPNVACVTWKDIVAAWGRILDSSHLGIAESLLVGDFLDYVEQHFPGLRPYSRVALCGRDHRRLTRRCKAVLREVAMPESVQYHRGWGWYVDLPGGQIARKLGFFPEVGGKEPCLVLEIDPGDTMGQARKMFRDSSFDSIQDLLDGPYWHGWPNFHLMYMSSGFFRPGHLHDLPKYWRIWDQNRDLIRTWKREEYARAFGTLVELGVASASHRQDFEACATQTKRESIKFVPGVTLTWKLPLDEAAQLDDRDCLEDRVVGAIEEGTRALDLNWPRFRRTTAPT